MEQPPRYVQNDSSLVFHLNNSLYGLKQVPRAWYEKMDNFLIDIGFSRCHSDSNIYTRKVGSHLIILVLYVYDFILIGSDSKLLNHVKTNLKKKFEMTDLGFLHYFLGLQVLQTNEGIFISQSKYACDLLRHFHMDDCKSDPSPFQSGVKIAATCTSPEVDATLYHHLVGSLLYSFFFFFFLFYFYVCRNQQLVGHVLALHVAVLSNRYHYNLQVCPRCPLRDTQGKSGGVELETSWNFIFTALAN
jgi:hypothetical protein